MVTALEMDFSLYNWCYAKLSVWMKGQSDGEEINNQHLI